jgi:hypothetical protein
MMNKILEQRIAELREMGLIFNFEDGFIGTGEFKDFNIHNVEITCDSQEDWQAKITSMKAEINRRNK